MKKVWYGTLATLAFFAAAALMVAKAATTSSTSSTVSSTVPSADLAITNAVDNAAPPAGAIVNYTITVSDLGPGTALETTVQDALPIGLVFDSADPSTGSYDATSGLWTVGDLDASTTATLAIQATIDAAAGTTIADTATAAGSASATASLTVTNATSSPLATNTLTVLVTGLASGTQAAVSVANLSLGTINSVTTGNGSSSFMLDTDDNYDVTAATLPGYALTTSGECSGILASDTACTLSFAPAAATPIADLTISKMVDNAEPEPGSDVNYTLTVSASGPETSTGAMATDLLPSGLSFLNATPSEGTYASTTGAWDIGDMPANSTATLLISAMVDPGTAGQIITNSATVGEMQSVTNMSGNTSSAVSITVLTPTSTPPSMPAPTPPPETLVPSLLTINPNGDFLARGMQVTSVGSTSFEGTIWGITYTVDWSGGAQPQFFFRNGNDDTGLAPSAQVAAGDTVGVSGSLDPANPLTVDAQVVRDYSIAGPRAFSPLGNEQPPQAAPPTTGAAASFQSQLSELAQQLQNLEMMFKSQFGGQ